MRTGVFQRFRASSLGATEDRGQDHRLKGKGEIELIKALGTECE
jgi:hypothetical protein